MTIEEKAKAYDEALERAIEFQKSKDGLCVLTAESIFPELRESEDERIRKWLSECVENLSDGNFIEVSRQDVLCYLEKQKEQKPAQTDDEKEYIRTIKSIISDFIRDKKPKDVAYYQRIYNWLDRRHIEQKPLEWSEEDEKQIRQIERIVKNAGCTSKLQEKIHNWLKSLRPQPHEEIYQSAKRDLTIKFMNYLDENRPDGKMCLSNAESEDIDKAFKENDWAKIMRYADKYLPHWKPSDEQEEPEYYQHFDPDC